MGWAWLDWAKTWMERVLNGLGWSGMGWGGMGWDRMGWGRLGRGEVEWSGLVLDGMG